jgi:hypothetical protein
MGEGTKGPVMTYVYWGGGGGGGVETDYLTFVGYKTNYDICGGGEGVRNKKWVEYYVYD